MAWTRCPGTSRSITFCVSTSSAIKRRIIPKSVAAGNVRDDLDIRRAGFGRRSHAGLLTRPRYRQTDRHHSDSHDYPLSHSAIARDFNLDTTLHTEKNTVKHLRIKLSQCGVARHAPSMALQLTRRTDSTPRHARR